MPRSLNAQRKPKTPVRTRAAFAKAIREKWQQSVEAIVAVGRLLEEAKAILAHGQFERMVADDLPFGPRSARMLMAVARHPTLSNRKHASDLPASWYTLYEMTRLPEKALTKAISKGQLGPETKRSDVAQLRDALRHGHLTSPSRRRSKTATAGALEDLIEAGERFGCIYADPPWPYDNQGTRGATRKHYPTMALEDIAALPVAKLAGDRSHLHLWTTSSFLLEACEVLKAWEFDYKGTFIWVKPDLGIGNYWRVSHELLLLGVRGACPFRDRGQRSWLEQPRELHSAKPSEIRRRIEKVSPGPYLELFARQRPGGWTAWGLDLPAKKGRKTSAA